MKVKEPTGAVLFEEKQYFPKWIMFLLLGQMILVIAGLVFAMRYEDRRGEILLSLSLIIPFECLMFFFFQRAALEKIITREGFYYRWLPLQKKYRLIQRTDIASMEECASPSMQYGFGYTPGYGRYHNMRKGMGIRFYLSDGKKVFFSTDDLLSFERSIREFLTPKTVSGER
jgi:hypothetical protein